MSQYTHFDIGRRGDITEISLVDTKFFDADDYAQLQTELMQFAQEQKPEKLLVDFSRIEYCSTAVMNGLLRVRDYLLSRGCQIKFCAMRSQVRDAFRNLKLDGPVFEIYAHSEDAVAAF